MNNSLILAKGRSARLSRRRRWGFRPSRGKPAARARVRARLIGGKLTSKNGGNAGFLPCYFPFRSYGTKNRSQSPWNRPIGARLANLTSETSSQLTPPSSGESSNYRFCCGGARFWRAVKTAAPAPIGDHPTTRLARDRATVMLGQLLRRQRRAKVGVSLARDRQRHDANLSREPTVTGCAVTFGK